jgi:hypothetical protein
MTGPDTAPPPAHGPVPGATPPQGWTPGAPPAWTPGPPLPEAPVRKPRSRVVRIAVPVAIAVGLGVLRLTGVFGGAQDPSVGDCVHSTGSDNTSFTVVDCSSKDAQYKVVGIDPVKMTSGDFQADDSLCSDVPETTVVLWSGQETEKGTVYCAAPVGAAG